MIRSGKGKHKVLREDLVGGFDTSSQRSIMGQKVLYSRKGHQVEKYKVVLRSDH